MRAGEAGRPRNTGQTMIGIVIVAAVLYLAREVFIPLALAILLSFLLAPFLGFLTRHKIPRVPAVLVVVITTFLIIGGMGYLVTTQVYDLAKKLPQYQDNVKSKLHALRPSGGGWLDRANHFFRETSKELEARSNDSQATVNPSTEQKPLPVEVHAPKPSALQVLRNYVGPMLQPLGVAGIVIIFVIFMLLEREALRDRFIRLAGTGQLNTTTEALTDAGARVSRYLLMQLIVNVTYGLPIGIGLYFIGVPNPLLWGLMATVLRFIPYIGPWLAAAIPLSLAFAVDPGWSMLLWAIGLYVVVELISNNAVEPWLYGSSTGLSSLAILVTAVFWTWLWGPVGLLLSTPLTVCLVVIGRYFPQLEFLNVLLGDEPVLSENARFYQRLLAGDQEEAENLAEEFLLEHSLGETFDVVIVPALALSETDRHGGSLPENRQAFIIETTTEIVKNLQETSEETQKEPSPGQATESEDAKVLCLPAKDEADEVAGNMLSILLNKKGIPARAATAKTLLNETLEQMEKKHVTIVCVSCVPPSGLRHARYLCKRVRNRFPEVKIIMGVWGSQEEPQQIKQRLQPATIDAVVFRMNDAVEQAAAMTTITESMLPAPVPENEPERLEELKRLEVLEAPPDEAYDNLTRELARTFDVPISLVTIIDEKRQVWKAQTGLPPDLASAHSGPREESICGHVVAANEPLIVPDLIKDKRFAGNPFVKERGIRFYAGVPLRTHTGQAIGSLCIIDTKPHQLSEGEKAYLQMMAERLIDEMEVRVAAASEKSSAARV